MTSANQQFRSTILSGLKSYSGRSIFNYVIQTISVFVMAAFLRPEDYASFAIISGWVGVAMFFSDIGLGEILVRQKETLTQNAIENYLGVRLALALGCFLTLFLATDWLTLNFKLPAQYQWIRYVGVLILLDVLSSAARLDLSHQLKFPELAKVEAMATFGLYTVQISAAIFGMGVLSFFLGLLTRSILLWSGLSFYAGHWHRPQFHWQQFAPRWKEGALYQFNALILSLKAMLIPYVLVGFLSPEQVGLYYWMTGLVSVPLMFVYNYHQILYPALSKLQDQGDIFLKTSDQLLQKYSFFIFMIFSMGAVAAPFLVTLLFKPQWHGATYTIAFAAVGVFLFSLRYMTSATFMAKGLIEARIGIEMLAIVAEIFAVIYFSSRGLPGLFIAIILSAFVFLLVSMFYLHQKKLLGTKTILLFTLYAFIIGLLALASTALKIKVMP